MRFLHFSDDLPDTTFVQEKRSTDPPVDVPVRFPCLAGCPPTALLSARSSPLTGRFHFSGVPFCLSSRVRVRRCVPRLADRWRRIVGQVNDLRYNRAHELLRDDLSACGTGDGGDGGDVAGGGAGA